jgi:uncharacterized membrane protein
MRNLNKWIRQIHRWLVVPLLLAIIYLLSVTLLKQATADLPIWLTITAIGSLLLLLLNGIYMFTLHYWARWRLSGRAR